MFKHTVQWYKVHSHCATITAIHPQNKSFSSSQTRTPIPFSLPQAPGNRHSTSCHYQFDYSRALMKVKSYSICHFVTGLSHWYVLKIYPRGRILPFINQGLQVEDGLFTIRQVWLARLPGTWEQGSTDRLAVQGPLIHLGEGRHGGKSQLPPWTYGHAPVVCTGWGNGV